MLRTPRPHRDRLLLTWPNLINVCVAVVLLYLPGAAMHSIALTVVATVEAVTIAPERYAAHSSFPQETRAVIAATVLMFVPIGWAITQRWRSTDWSKRSLDEYRRYSPTRVRLMNWLGWPLLIGGIFVGFVFVGRDPSWCQGCVNHSKIGLLFFVLIGPSTFFVLCLSAYDWYRWRLSLRAPVGIAKDDSRAS
jgi:hypothetical protein